MERRTIAVIVLVVLLVAGYAALYEWNHEHVYDRDMEYTYTLTEEDGTIGGWTAGTGREYVIATVHVTVDGSKDLSYDDMKARILLNELYAPASATSYMHNPETLRHGETTIIHYVFRLPAGTDLSDADFYITVDGWDVSVHRPSYILGAILAV